MILLKPHLTEKSLKQASNQVYTFKVNPEASKEEIKTTIESSFKVNVVAVRTVSRRGLLKRSYRTGKYSRQRGGKLAYVTLAPKQTINYFSTESK
jgi:large subunit ribosomal protein L23